MKCDCKIMVQFLHQVIVTQRAGHAFDVITSITNSELKYYDGVVTVVSHVVYLYISCLLRVLVVACSKPCANRLVKM